MFVFINRHLHGRSPFPANDLFADFEGNPVFAASIFAIATILDPGIDTIHERVSNSPRQIRRPSRDHAWNTGHGGAHRVASFTLAMPAQDRFVPDGRQTVDFQMRIVAEHGLAGRSFAARHHPIVGSGRSR